LRGTTPNSQLSFDSVYLETARGTPLERQLRGAILSQGNTVLATDPKTAAVTLRILSEAQEKKILTLNAQGQVREFSLLYRIRFEVADKENKKLLEPNELALQAFLSYSESQALAKETEERMTYDDLRRDAVSQIMRQLSRIKPEQ
jgi:LPS-assembly lipoprotein